MTATVALIRDTFREALARKIFWGLFGLSTVMILFFLFLLKIDIVEGALATVSIFGRTSGRANNLEKLVLGVYGGIAAYLYVWGMVIAVFASAGLIPSVLEPGRIELLLSKPVSRTHILIGRYIGNVLVISCNIVYLVLGVWLIFGFKTGIWDGRFLIAIFTTIFSFAVLLAVVVLVGVLFESAALATMITVAIMIMSAVLAQTSTMMKLLSSEFSRSIWRLLYWVFPKIYDLGHMTLSAISDHSNPLGFMPIWTSLFFGVVVFGAALLIFARRDF